jgi:hypothetical protein
LDSLEGKKAEPMKVRPVAKVEGAVLDTYVGKYQLAPGFVLDVTREGDRLYVQATGQPRCRVHPASATRFFYRVVEAELEFAKDGSKVVLTQNGRDMEAPRLKR